MRKPVASYKNVSITLIVSFHNCFCRHAIIAAQLEGL